MAKYKNPEHFNINGDKTVEVVLRFDVGERVSDQVALRNAQDYLTMFLMTQSHDDGPVHKAWGRSIEVRDA